MALLEIRNISKRYSKDVPVLNDVELSIQAGEIFFLLGPSGCGKSTLLRILAGLVKPDSGRVILNGKDITDLPPEKRNTPMVFQNYALWPHMNVFDNVAFGPKLRKLSSGQIRQEVDQLLETVGMTEYRNRLVTELSGGQQQRVALARALALNAPLLLLDEPLSNLDAKLRDRMRVEIRRICRVRNLTAVYVTHDRREALSIGDRIAVMNDGVLQQAGSPRELYQHPVNQFTASFLGDVNLFSAVFRGTAPDGLHHFETKAGNLAVRLHENGKKPQPGKKYMLLARPESVLFDAPETAQNRFVCRITENTYLGESTSRIMELDGIEIHATEFPGPDRPEGSSVSCAIPPDRLVLLEA